MTAKPNLIEQAARRNWQIFIEDPDLKLRFGHLESVIKPILGMSDFVAESLVVMPELIDWLIIEGELDKAEDDYQSLISEILTHTINEQQLLSNIRLFRRKHMVKIAWRDLLNKQSIGASVLAVSELADALIIGTYSWLYQDACKKYGIPEGEHGPQQMLIIGMGKLGGRELNFSSDIDLIFTYPANGTTSGATKNIDHSQFFTRLAQKLIGALDKHSIDGRVFRVDMRLRPYGESGPLVSQFAALEDYYQFQGREWERYALIKARILNPPSQYCEDLRTILNPFIYRRYLDFSAIQSLREMKSMISREVRRRQLTDNIKLGSGGIREVEFIVQSVQLIRGGQEPSLQKPSILSSIQSLVILETFTKSDAEHLLQAYFYLRKVEHCLQQFADCQTQVLPDDPLNQNRLCNIMGESNYPQLLQKLKQHMQVVNSQFESLIGSENDIAQDENFRFQHELSDFWQLDLDHDEATILLNPIFKQSNTRGFIEAVFNFKDSLDKRQIGKRGRDTLRVLMPTVLCVLVEHHYDNLDRVVDRVLAVISAISGRTTYLQLLNENAGAIEQLVKLCAASPWISAQIQRFPMLLDELLNPNQLYNPPALNEYRSDLTQAMLRVEADDLELQMEVLRQFKLSEQLKIAAADVTNILPVMKVSDHLTFLAQAIIDEVLALAWQQMVARYGSPEGTSTERCGFAVIGYGKLGGQELGYGSDLDLVFLHDAQRGSYTQGSKSIESSQFFTKLAQRIMHIFSTKTTLGQLYEVDMRLRPSGNAGLLVCHHGGFLHYQQSEAWTWEHQALVRARFIAGDPSLAPVFDSLRKQVLIKNRQISNLAADVVEMREKMRSHLSIGDKLGFDIKQDKGGIADIEFMVQFWVLAYSEAFPELTTWSDNIRILHSLTHCKILSEDMAKRLTQAYLSYRHTTHNLALQENIVVEKRHIFDASIAFVTQMWSETFTSVK